MDHVYTLLMLVIPCSVLCGDVPAPENITMDSHHFIHLLKWKAGPGSPVGLHYSVIFRSYRNGWRTVDSCVEVRYPLLCNLTDALFDPNETYYINVTAFLGKETSAPRTSRPFRPVSDTELEPPSIRVSPCNDSLCVYLQSPSQTLDEVYKKFRYVFNVTNEKGVQFTSNTKGFDTLELKVVPGLQYCVSTLSIEDRRPTHKTPVCSSRPAAGINTDAVIPVFFILLALGVVIFLSLVSYRRLFKTNPPLVLSSFNAPYKEQLLWPSVESLTCVSLEPNTCINVQVNEEADQEKEDEEVTYERLRGCEDVECCEETNSSLPRFPEIQYECNHKPGTKTYTDRKALKKQTLTPDVIRPQWEATSPQATSQILTTHHLPLKKQIPELKRNSSPLLGYKSGDEHRQEKEEEEKEDSDNVNFFSLVLGGQNSEQPDEAEEDEEEQMDNVLKVKPEAPLFVLEPPKPAMDIQPTSSESTDKHVSYSEEEEEEDTDEDEDFSGYMMRN